jgi:predicted transcriptional regulator
MEVQLAPDLERQLRDLAAATGRSPSDLIADAFAGYASELAYIRQSIDSRYDDLKSSRVQPIDGEAFFESLRLKEEQLLANPVK